MVRPCRHAEIPAVLALWCAAEVVPSGSDNAGGLPRLLDTGDDALLVAEADGRVVGALIAAWDAGAATCTGWRCCRVGAGVGSCGT